MAGQGQMPPGVSPIGTISSPSPLQHTPSTINLANANDASANHHIASHLQPLPPLIHRGSAATLTQANPTTPTANQRVDNLRIFGSGKVVPVPEKVKKTTGLRVNQIRIQFHRCCGLCSGIYFISHYYMSISFL